VTAVGVQSALTQQNVVLPPSVIKPGEVQIPPSAYERAIAGLSSKDYLTQTVDCMYKSFFNRSAFNDPQGLAVWVNFLAQGGSEELLAAVLIGSQEYFNRSGGTNQQLVQAIYGKILVRVGSAPEINYWVSQLPRLGRTGVALSIIDSVEAASKRLDRLFDLYLQRQSGGVFQGADAGAKAYFVPFLQSGRTQYVIASILSSDEFLRKFISTGLPGQGSVLIFLKESDGRFPCTFMPKVDGCAWSLDMPLT